MVDDLEMLLALTEKQQKLLQEEELNMDKFNTTVERKQKIIDKLKQLEGERKPNEEEKAILEKIVRLDEENKELFNMQYEQTKIQLKKIREGKKQNTFYGNVGYGNPYEVNPGEGRFFDKRGR